MSHPEGNIGGVVIVRQRPGTAAGICFATIEDETGLANVVFMPDFYRANRSTIWSTMSMLPIRHDLTTLSTD